MSDRDKVMLEALGFLFAVHNGDKTFADAYLSQVTRDGELGVLAGAVTAHFVCLMRCACELTGTTPDKLFAVVAQGLREA